MTKRDIFTLSIRLIGICTIISGIAALPLILAIQQANMNALSTFDANTTLITHISTTWLISIGIIVLLLAGYISSWLIKEDSVIPLPEWLSDKKTVFKTAIQIIGLYMAADNLPKFIQHICSPVGIKGIGTALTIQYALMVVIGLIMLFCVKYLPIHPKGEN